MEMTKNLIKFHVEGVDWNHNVKVDAEIFETERDQYIEAASAAIEKQMKLADLNLGPIVTVKKDKCKKEALVNSFICLNNIGQFELAQTLRQNFKKAANGQDLSLDETGFSF
jgi:hypothetical protein